MRVYVSIPISGHDLAAQKAKAEEIADKLRKLGHEPVNPFDTPPPSGNLSEKELYAFYMGEDVKKLLTCDAVYLCDGWAMSNGCRAEIAIAEVYGIKRYYYNHSFIDDIPNNK